MLEILYREKPLYTSTVWQIPRPGPKTGSSASQNTLFPSKPVDFKKRKILDEALKNIHLLV